MSIKHLGAKVSHLRFWCDKEIMSVLLLPLTSLGSLDNSTRPHVLFHAVDVEKNTYMCVYMCPWKPEDSIRFPINLIDWMTRKYPGSPCVLGFYCHDKTLTQSNLVMKGFISFYSLQSIIEGTVQELEAGADAEVVEQHCLLACSLFLAQPTVLYHLGPPL